METRDYEGLLYGDIAYYHMVPYLNWSDLVQLSMTCQRASRALWIPVLVRMGRFHLCRLTSRYSRIVDWIEKLFICEECLECLKDIPKQMLQRMKPIDVQTENVSLDALESFSTLNSLVAYNCFNGFSSISCCPNLTFLELYNVRIESFDCLATLVWLETISIINQEDGDYLPADWSPFAHLENLLYLKVQSPRDSDLDLSPLSMLPIRYLSLSFYSLPLLSFLQSMTHLEELDLYLDQSIESLQLEAMLKPYIPGLLIINTE